MAKLVKVIDISNNCFSLKDFVKDVAFGAAFYNNGEIRIIINGRSKPIESISSHDRLDMAIKFSFMSESEAQIVAEALMPSVKEELAEDIILDDYNDSNNVAVSVIRSGKWVDFDASGKIITGIKAMPEVIVKNNKGVSLYSNGVMYKCKAPKNLYEEEASLYCMDVLARADISNSPLALEVTSLFGMSPSYVAVKKASDDFSDVNPFLYEIEEMEDSSRKTLLKALLTERGLKEILSNEKVNETLYYLIGDTVSKIVSYSTTSSVVEMKTGTKILVPMEIFSPVFVNQVDKFTIAGQRPKWFEWVAISIAACRINSGDYISLIKRIKNMDNVSMYVGQYPANTGYGSVSVIKANVGGLIYPAFKYTEDSVFAVQEGKTVTAIGDGNKIISRIGSIINSPEIIKIDNLKICVIADKGGLDDKFWHALSCGAAIVSQNIFTRYGSFRFVSNTLGLKAESVPMTSSMQRYFGQYDIVVGPNSVKAGARGVYCCLSGASPREMFAVEDRDILSYIGDFVSTVDTEFGKCNVIECVESVKITNWHTIEGIKTPDGVNDSVYNFAIEKFKAGDIYSMPAYIAGLKKAGMVKSANGKIKLTYGAIQNVAMSYGYKSAQNLVDSLDKSGMSIHFSKEEYVEYSSKESSTIMSFFNGLFKGRLSTSVVSDESLSKDWDVQSFMKVLGSGITINGVKFAGFGTINIVMNLGGHKFVFPKKAYSGENLFMPVYDQYGKIKSIRLGEMAAQFILLLVAYRNSSNNWAKTYIAYNSVLNCQLFENSFGSLPIKGKYQVLVPVYWDTVAPHQVWSSIMKDDRNYIYGKQPVIFDKAVTGVSKIELDTLELFGNNSEAFKEAMSSMIFSSPDLIMGQRNDCDGDMAFIAEVDESAALPLYTEQDYCKKWFDEYTEDECSSSVLKSGLKRKTIDVSESIVDFVNTIQAKENIGIYTSVLFAVQHVLDAMLQKKGIISRDSASKIKEVYACVMQDSAISAIKHDTSSDAVSMSEIQITDSNNKNKLSRIASTIVSYGKMYGEDISIKDAAMFVMCASKLLAKSNIKDWRASSLADEDSGELDYDAIYALCSELSGNVFTLYSMFTRAYWVKAKNKAFSRHINIALKQKEQNVVQRYTRVGASSKFMDAFNITEHNTMATYIYCLAMSQAKQETQLSTDDIVILSELGIRKNVSSVSTKNTEYTDAHLEMF